MCAVDDCEPLGMGRQAWRTARKEHRCCECRRAIGRGERYEVTTGLADGTWCTWRVCEHCRAAARWLDVMCGGWPFTCLGDELREHWLDGYSSAVLGRLVAGVRLKWLDGRIPVPEHAADDARRQLARLVA